MRWTDRYEMGFVTGIDVRRALAMLAFKRPGTTMGDVACNMLKDPDDYGVEETLMLLDQSMEVMR